MYNTKLWEVSGHLKNYAENMFMVNVEKEQFALKPMNCPGHCLMFGHRERSYRELPMRIADFGVLHRNEASGALTGLTRVRRFQQDDAHIFCRLDQLATEMAGCLDFLQHIYGIFGFSFDLRLSTRPENYLGDLETWDRAEGLLSEALTSFGHPWDFNPGDGAFYGPKIDITISDALRRKHQCATIQLDFQLPQRFDLNYRTDDHDNPFARPIMIHRAILGSVERMIAILCENYGGKWPFWLSPRQVIVVPISHSNDDYASSVAEQMHAVGIHCEADLSDNMFKKKIRNAEISQANFILIVGQEEQDTLSVNLRNRDDLNSKSRGKIQKLDSVIAKLVELNTSLENQSQVQFDFEQLEIKK